MTRTDPNYLKDKWKFDIDTSLISKTEPTYTPSQEGPTATLRKGEDPIVIKSPTQTETIPQTQYDRDQAKRLAEQQDLRRLWWLKSEGEGLSQHEKDALWREMLGDVGAREDLISPEAITGEQLAREEEIVGIAGKIGSQISIDPTSLNPVDVQTGKEITGMDTSIDWGQTMRFAATNPSTFASAIQYGGAVYGGAAVAAKTGAKVGSLAGPKGIIAGAVLGFALGVYRQVHTNIRSQRSDHIGAISSTRSDAERNLRRLVMLANMDKDNAEKHVDDFNDQLNRMDQAYSDLRILTQQDLSLALGEDGTRELQRFANFNAPGGSRVIWQRRMAKAIDAPDPTIAMQMLMSDEDLIGGEYYDV